MSVTESHEMKTCPDCAEDVKAAARICRFCGHAFEPAHITKTQGAAPLGTTRKVRPRSHVIGALTVLGVAACLIAVLVFATSPDSRRTNGRSSLSRFDRASNERPAWAIPAAAAIGIAGFGAALLLVSRPGRREM